MDDAHGFGVRDPALRRGTRKRLVLAVDLDYSHSRSMARIEVPITPEVLQWAIVEGGFTPADLAERVGVSLEIVDAWVDGVARPSMGEFRRIIGLLKRPFATFFLPSPPPSSTSEVKFRRPIDTERKSLLPRELTVIRDARRIQQAIRWALVNIERKPVKLPAYKLSDEASDAAQYVRNAIGKDNLASKNVSEAQATWREALEDLGILVFLLPLGEESCRGFSTWDDHAPLIVVNTWWRPEARIFSMLHELGHLLTRSDSACLEHGYGHKRRASDREERWCEKFAASLAIPEQECLEHLDAECGWRPGKRMIREIAVAQSIAQRFKVSVTASAIRMIELGAADWTLLRSIKRNFDFKKSGGGGGQGDRTPTRRLREYGSRTAQIFDEAVRKDVYGRDDVLEYLCVGDNDFEEMLGAK